MTRSCLKCTQNGVDSKLSINSDLGYMECETGRHIEPINLTGRLWWNQCPECKGIGLNRETSEAVSIKSEKGKPVVYRRSNVQPITCKHCGKEFTKKPLSD